MRILQVIPTYLPALRYGGPIIAVHSLCRALVARGNAVDVFTTNVNGARRSASQTRRRPDQIFCVEFSSTTFLGAFA
jgi:glycogen synthase